MAITTTPDPTPQVKRAVRNASDGLDAENPLRDRWSRPAENIGANALSCDVEDYFQVSAFEHLVSKESWDTYECRISGNVDRILGMLSDANVKATFFTLGWVASRLPEVPRRIVDEGHELASHGMNHTRIWAQSSDEFRKDVTDTKKLLEDVSGVEVRGYRAASWSLDERSPWAHEILSDTACRMRHHPRIIRFPVISWRYRQVPRACSGATGLRQEAGIFACFRCKCHCG
jgi:peptidoglycan/xylan/chitin deacetylase (PgdA/CDA1 family)